jgi:hypothetical protein
MIPSTLDSFLTQLADWSSADARPPRDPNDDDDDEDDNEEDNGEDEQLPVVREPDEE